MRDGDILVLGATGKVGRLLRARWRAEDLSVLWQGRSAGAGPGWTAWTPGQPLPPAPVVVLLSGVTSGSDADLAQNSRIGLEVARAAVAGGVRGILLASTMAVYGRTPPSGAAEDTPPRDPRPYGLSKRAMEAAMARALAGTGTGLTALRIGNVAGADMLGMVVAAGRKVRLDRFPDGKGPERSYAGPGLLARVIAGLSRRILSGETLPDVLNVAGQAPVAMAEILRGARLAFDWQEAGPGAVQRVHMDCARLAALVPPDPAAETAAALAAEWQGGLDA